MVADTAEMIAATQKAGGKVSLVRAVRHRGPANPMKDPKGSRVFHVSRTWFAEGPRWLLRGVLMGEAGQASGIDRSPSCCTSSSATPWCCDSNRVPAT